jgi:hypothetical protein
VADGKATAASPIKIAPGTLEALKWIALVAMLADHVNKYLFAHNLPWAYEAGRLALPLFLAVLAYNMAQPQTLANSAGRTMGRLVVFGLLASVPYTGLDKTFSWWPLNVLFTMFVLVLCIKSISQRKYWLATLAFALGGLLVEYWWPAILLGLSFWAFYRSGSTRAAVAVVASTAILSLVNMNAWAFAALPLLLMAPHVDAKFPRMKWLFYGFYPLHLAVILFIRLANAV